MNKKALIEQRLATRAEMLKMVSTAENETRAMTEEELKAFNELAEKVKSITGTLDAMGEIEKTEITEPAKPNAEPAKETVEEDEVRAFAQFVRGEVLEERAEKTLNMTDNGAVLPKTIAQRIIKKVYDICPIFEKAEKYNVKGTLSIPYYDESTQSVTMAYATDFTELESQAGKFTNIDLTGFLAGALAKVSKSLVNNTDFDVVNFIVNQMAETISRFIEKELLNGTASKVAGLSGVNLAKATASATAITMDEVIELKDLVKDAFQNNAMFIMNSDTRTKMRLLKDGNGRYLMQDDVNSPFGTTLLGKPVYVTDNMVGMTAGKTAIYYGDFSGLAVKLSEEANVEVLREKFATQHAIGVVAWMEFDSKVQDAQKIAKLVMKTA